MTSNQKCTTCQGANREIFFELPPIPTMDGVMSSTREEAFHVPKGEVTLSFCLNCGAIRNEAYESEKISFSEYDFSNDFSQKFSNYIDKVTSELVERHALSAKSILDVGCGNGDFLQRICQKGGNRGVGIDPGFDHSEGVIDPNVDVQFIQDVYSDTYADLKPDFIACRHVLNVIDDQVALVNLLRKNINDTAATTLYFEVPNMLYTFREKIIWNVTYENRAWYTIDTLEYLLRKCGFATSQPCLRWHDEFISIEARPMNEPRTMSLPSQKVIAEVNAVLKEFTRDYHLKKEEYRLGIDTIRKEGGKTVAWGAGARAVTFFNIFGISNEIPMIVDININRQGKFLPGTAQQIISPRELSDIQPDKVVITNPTYADEIVSSVKEMGLNPDFWVL